MNALRSLLLSVIIGLIALTPAIAQSERAKSIENATRSIAEIRTAVSNNQSETPTEYEQQLRDIRTAARGRLSDIEREIETIRAQIDLLGPAPGENAPPESESLASERATLERTRIQLNGERTRVLANVYETGELLTKLSGMRVGALYSKLATRTASPLAPSQLLTSWRSAQRVIDRIGLYIKSWADQKRADGELAHSLVIIFLALAISLFMFSPVNHWIAQFFSTALEKRQPSSARKMMVVGLKMAARAVPGLIGGLVIIETLRLQDFLTPEGEDVARAFWGGVLSILLVSSFTAAFFAPLSPKWRIAPINTKQGRTVSLLAFAIVAFFSFNTLLTAIVRAADADETLVSIGNSDTSIVIGICLFLLCRSHLWVTSDKPDSHAWRAFRDIGKVLGVLLIIAALAGYVPLAYFITTRIVYLALFIGVAWLLRATLAEAALALRNRLADEEDRIDETQSNNYRFWSRLIINTLLFIVLTPALLVLFGLPGATVQDLVGQALFGFNIAGVQIPSVVKFFSAIIVFVAIMGVTKLLQRTIQRGPLAHSNADSGVQNSLITLFGYAGLVIAIFASISSLGFDLGNLALIAGALSVGIGFGLQSIVNNFVSGLILLFERPIKVGDWIVTPSGEGTVKKISVRSTEIETFDRSSIIVPNSELISSTVTNWTHKDKIGRIHVRVGVSYSSDPEKVREILLQCAAQHPLVVRFPEPFVVWHDFGASSLDFDLRAYLIDISMGIKVRTELRFAIFKAFAEEGIEIPFPQQDVYIKSMPDGFRGETEEKDA